MEKYGTAGQTTDDNIIRRMRTACWINKATDTHWEYVTRIAFRRQQWLRKRAQRLHSYVHCVSRCECFLLRHFSPILLFSISFFLHAIVALSFLLLCPSISFHVALSIFRCLHFSLLPTSSHPSLSSIRLFLPPCATARAASARAATAVRRNNVFLSPAAAVQIGFVSSTSCCETWGQWHGQRCGEWGADKDWEGGVLQR